MKHYWSGLQLWLGSLCVTAILTGACSDNTVEQAPRYGRLQFALAGTSTSGAKYRLRWGTFNITGASTLAVSTEDQLQADSISLELVPGNYAIALDPGWILEQAMADGGFEIVKAALSSANPQLFAIEEQKTSSVRFRFQVGDDIFELGNGGVTINIDVEDSAGNAGGIAGAAGQGTAGSTSTSSAVFEAGPMMQVDRMNHVTVSLDDGRALLLGGHGTNFVSLNSAELFDPTNNSLTSLSMQSPRDLAAVQKLADGRYLIAGGAYDLGVAPGYQTAELFNPKTLAFSATGNMVRPRMESDAELLPDGRVLIVGGWYSNDSATYGEIYDPAKGTFAATGALNTPRASPVLLPTVDGRVVVLGGTSIYGDSIIGQVEVYSPTTNAFTVLRDRLMPSDPGVYVTSQSRGRADEQRLSDGRYLLLAGNDVGTTTPMVAFNPETLGVTRLDGFDQGGGPLVFDSSHQLAYVPYYPAAGQLGIARFDILAQTTKLLPVAGFEISYNLGYMGVIFVDPTRIWFSGGFSCSGSSTNFCPVSDTFFVRLAVTP